MAKNNKTYTVNIDMKWSIDYIVEASSQAEAQQKAWEKFKKKPPKKLFELMVANTDK